MPSPPLAPHTVKYGQEEVAQSQFFPSKGRKWVEPVCTFLACLWATWGTHFCLAWLGDQWERLHRLGLRLEAVEGSGSFHGRWKLHGTTDMQNMTARNYRQRNIVEPPRPQEGVKFGGKLRHLKTSYIQGNWGKNAHTTQGRKMLH